MKTAGFAAAAVMLLFVVGCGGVDAGGIPVDVGGLNLNGDFNFGDINLGGGGGEFEEELLSSLTEEELSNTELTAEEPSDVEAEEPSDAEIKADKDLNPHPADTNGDFSIDSDELLAYGVAFQDNELPAGQDESWLDAAVSIWQARADGAYSDDMESPEPFNWKPVVDDEPQADQPEPHPADTDNNFLLTSEEVLAYASAFQGGELPNGQDESWLDVAVSIWQARADGAYFDDMESPLPLNWRSMDESGVVAESGAVANDESGAVDEEIGVGDAGGDGYDILFKVTPLSPIPFDLTVIDPTEKYNSLRTPPEEIGWTEGTAWDGFYRVQVYAGSNYNGVNEQVRFSISIYKDGELVLEEEHALAESSLWDDLSVAYP